MPRPARSPLEVVRSASILLKVWLFVMTFLTAGYPRLAARPADGPPGYTATMEGGLPSYEASAVGKEVPASPATA